jgi:hypothetical protein
MSKRAQQVTQGVQTKMSLRQNADGWMTTFKHINEIKIFFQGPVNEE